MNQFFIIEFKIYEPSHDEEFRLFRPNIPAVKGSERWIHTKAPCANPNALVSAKPDNVTGGGMRLAARGAQWTFNTELAVWIFWAASSTEKEIEAFSSELSAWSPGRYRGEISKGYRGEA